MRQIRNARRKSLVVIAGLARISIKSPLDLIEHDEVALDRLSNIVALAAALRIVPSELLRLSVPAPVSRQADCSGAPGSVSIKPGTLHTCTCVDNFAGTSRTI